MNSFKKFFTRMSVDALVTDEIYEAEIALLKAETGLEWAQAQGNYNKQRLKRLREHYATKSVSTV